MELAAKTRSNAQSAMWAHQPVPWKNHTILVTKLFIIHSQYSRVLLHIISICNIQQQRKNDRKKLGGDCVEKI